jgi:double-strand break repair protein MRE11
MDLLSQNYYLNYFGKIKNIDKITVKPVLFKKSDIKLAVYGIGYMKNERLSKALTEKTVNFEKVPDKGWFKVLMLH